MHHDDQDDYQSDRYEDEEQYAACVEAAIYYDELAKDSGVL